MRLFGAHGSRNRDKEYSEINNALRFVKSRDLRAGLYPTSYRTVSTCFQPNSVRKPLKQSQISGETATPTSLSYILQIEPTWAPCKRWQKRR